MRLRRRDSVLKAMMWATGASGLSARLNICAGSSKQHALPQATYWRLPNALSSLSLNPWVMYLFRVLYYHCFLFCVMTASLSSLPRVLQSILSTRYHVQAEKTVCVFTNILVCLVDSFLQVMQSCYDYCENGRWFFRTPSINWLGCQL